MSYAEKQLLIEVMQLAFNWCNLTGNIFMTTEGSVKDFSPLHYVLFISIF